MLGKDIPWQGVTDVEESPNPMFGTHIAILIMRETVSVKGGDHIIPCV